MAGFEKTAKTSRAGRFPPPRRGPRRRSRLGLLTALDAASLVLWRKPRNPPSVAACALDPGVDATAAARPELLHGNSPSALDARVPVIQGPSARSHRTVDNSFITSRIEYSHSSATENSLSSVQLAKLSIKFQSCLLLAWSLLS